MAGTIKLDGTTFLTKDNSNNFTLDVGSGGSVPTVGTITSGTIGSNVTFPAGHVIQTVSQLYTSATTVTSTSYSDAGPSLDITPSSTSNKIFVFFDVDNYFYKNGTDGRCKAKIVRTIGGSATDVLEQVSTGFFMDGGGSDKNIYTRTTFSLVDSPNTTSAATYKLQVRTAGATHVSMHNGTGTTFMLMEIKG